MNYQDVGERKIKPPARAVLVNRDDNVAILLSNVMTGETISLGTGWVEVAAEDILAGQKIAIKTLLAGQPVITHGVTIGTATRSIQRGEGVHKHNLRAA